MDSDAVNAHRWRKLLALIHSGEFALSRDTVRDRWGALDQEYFDGYFDVAKAVDAESDSIIKLMEKNYKNDFTSTDPNN